MSSNIQVGKKHWLISLKNFLGHEKKKKNSTEKEFNIKNIFSSYFLFLELKPSPNNPPIF